ncbi:alpha/beta fold hydrolase [Janibacter sp. YIM B02568]|uniref:alpha/beta hydrolase n=1 Tax=Janibacter endophyticus TaxID=2806261 RepID=UPI0019522208|nr:alpha/beta hydrolase [Janibacter endophyticus]MBM6547191.1 alpha/beta fold hydrolase [Janibacter endophyticus]
MRAQLLALFTATALVLSGCSLLPGQDEPTAVPADATQAPEGQEDLARFYEQRLDWGDCGDLTGECAELEVPVDYEQPEGETLRIGVLKVPAKREKQGSLVLNPGGPGGSGMEYASAADYVVSPQVRDRFDVVGFDPRGVGRSAPVDCLDDRALDEFLGSDPTPDDAAEEEQQGAVMRSMGQGCEELSGTIAPHMSTAEAARDMDVLRAALGESQLDYLGKSYGTYLGATYADLFRDKVGRFVLDGVLAPDLTAAEVNIGQAKGFDTATREWAAACVEEGCPFGGTQDEVIDRVRGILEDLDSNPVPGAAGLELTEGWATLGIAQAMYDQGAWSTLTDALASVEEGDGRDLMEMAFQYASRNAGGDYAGNIMEAIYAVNCLDRPEPEGAEREEMVEEAERVAPIWGQFIAGGSGPCSEWPWEPVGEPRPIDAKGANPILVVGTTRDPATPYEWAQRLHDQLADSRLITHEGDGHTAYMRQNDCVDKAVDTFWLTGELPAEDITCS